MSPSARRACGPNSLPMNSGRKPSWRSRRRRRGRGRSARQCRDTTSPTRRCGRAAWRGGGVGLHHEGLVRLGVERIAGKPHDQVLVGAAGERRHRIGWRFGRAGVKRMLPEARTEVETVRMAAPRPERPRRRLHRHPAARPVDPSWPASRGGSAGLPRAWRGSPHSPAGRTGRGSRWRCRNRRRRSPRSLSRIPGALEEVDGRRPVARLVGMAAESGTSRPASPASRIARCALTRAAAKVSHSPSRGSGP